MHSPTQKITPCLWFDGKIEAAAESYVSLFKNSSITHRARFGDGSNVVTVEFELGGYRVVGLNGGPQFAFTPAISFFVMCETKQEIDSLWTKITDGGGVMMPLGAYEWSERYGWGIDRFGLSWQRKLDIEGLRKAI